MFFAGAVQNALVALSPALGFVTFIDDLLLVVAVIIGISRFSTVSARYAVNIFLYFVLITIASARSVVSADLTFDLFRASLVPALLLAVGLVIRQSEWISLMRAWVLITTPTAIYMLIETLGLRPISPADYVRNGGVQTFLFENYDSLPGFYLTWAADGTVSERSGGLFMNPPVAGLAVAVSAVILAFGIRGVFRYPLLALHFGALWVSQGRGGVVLIVVAMIVPLLVRHIGRIPTLILAIPASVILYRIFSSTGDSTSHLIGLTDGLATVVRNPVGEGFGTAGNAVKLTLRNAESSESLLGLVMVAVGLPAFLLFCALAVALLRRAWRTPNDWISYLALAALMTAAVAESAGALAGASMLWLAAGIALAGALGVTKGHDKDFEKPLLPAGAHNRH